MKIHVKKMASSKFLFLFCLFLFLPMNESFSMSSYPYKYSIPEAQNYPELPYTLTELIEALPKPMPAKLETLQKMFDHKLHIIEQTKYFNFYSTDASFKTRDGVIIWSVSSSVKKTSPDLSVDINIGFDDKQCVDAIFLKKRFNFFVSTPATFDLPLSKSIMNIDAGLDWGRFSMNVPMINPDCASAIMISSFTDENDRQAAFYNRDQAKARLATAAKERK